MLRTAVPRPSADAASSSVGHAVRSGFRSGAFDDEAPLPEPRRWTRDEARALAEREPPLSPWWVVAAQAVLGATCGAIAWAAWGALAGWSALYGAAVVVVAGALMARGTTSPLATASPVAGLLSLVGFGVVKTAAVVLMLSMASRVLPGMNWVALLVTMAVCLQTYWLALAVRRRGTTD